jgi:hypothetical protein
VNFSQFFYFFFGIVVSSILLGPHIPNRTLLLYSIPTFARQINLLMPAFILKFPQNEVFVCFYKMNYKKRFSYFWVFGAM